MDLILSEIEKALKKKRLSAAAASNLAVGNPALIRNMKSGRSTDKRYNVGALEKLAAVLDLELYFGPPRDLHPFSTAEIDGDLFVPIPRYDAQLSAGSGAINDDAEPMDHLAFSRDWLDRLGVKPGDACLMTISGTSMAPALQDGDLVLIDRRRRTIKTNHTYAFNDIDGTSKVKRLGVTNDAIVLVSNDISILPKFRMGGNINTIADGIIGEVVWSGHTWK